MPVEHFDKIEIEGYEITVRLVTMSDLRWLCAYVDLPGASEMSEKVWNWPHVSRVTGDTVGIDTIDLLEAPLGDQAIFAGHQIAEVIRAYKKGANG